MLRILIILLCAVQIVVCGMMVYGAVNASSDAMGNAMIQGFATIAVFLTVIFVLPALLLAIFNSLLKLALVLSLAIPVLWLGLHLWAGPIL